MKVLLDCTPCSTDDIHPLNALNTEKSHSTEFYCFLKSWTIIRGHICTFINQYGFHNVVLNFPDLFGERNDYHCYNGTKGKICRNYGLDKHIANSTLTIARTARGKITSMFKEDYYINKFQQLNR